VIITLFNNLVFFLFFFYKYFVIKQSFVREKTPTHFDQLQFETKRGRPGASLLVIKILEK